MDQLVKFSIACGMYLSALVGFFIYEKFWGGDYERWAKFSFLSTVITIGYAAVNLIAHWRQVIWAISTPWIITIPWLAPVVILTLLLATVVITQRLVNNRLLLHISWIVGRSSNSHKEILGAWQRNKEHSGKKDEKIRERIQPLLEAYLEAEGYNLYVRWLLDSSDRYADMPAESFFSFAHNIISAGAEDVSYTIDNWTYYVNKLIEDFTLRKNKIKLSLMSKHLASLGRNEDLAIAAVRK